MGGFGLLQSMVTVTRERAFDSPSLRLESSVSQTHPMSVKPASRVLHALDFFSSKASAAALAAVVSTVALVWAWVSDEPEVILAWYEGVASAVVLVIVFLLQHTQTRQQVALQLKLDAVLNALRNADNRLISLESSSDEHIKEVKDRHSEILDQANS
jgi:low affinity Fe/Cu permease